MFKTKFGFKLARIGLKAVALVMVLLPVTTSVVYAAGPEAPAADLPIAGVINSIVELIKGVGKPLALLGIVAWGVAQFIQPFEPSVNQKFQGYAIKLVMGTVLIVFGAEIAETLWSLG